MKLLLSDHFEENEAEVRRSIVDLTCRLVRQRTVNVRRSELHAYPYMEAPGQEERVVSLLAQECVRCKIDHKIHLKEAGRPALVASVGKGRKKLVVACHTDVSPPGQGWKTDPFEPVVVDGSIVGRGALAAKGPLAGVMAAAVALKPMEKLLKGQLVIVAYPDHTVAVADGQDGCGIDYLLTEGLVKADFAIIPDVGKDLRGISVAEKGRALLRIRASGKRVHGAVPERGDNAIMKMVRLLHRLSSMTLPYKPHELMGRPTLNVGCISGGLSGSTVPAECEISVDIRYLPGQTATAIVTEIRKMAEEVGGGFEFVVESDSKPCQIDPDNILVRSIQENTSTLLGFEAQLAGTGRATVVRKFLERGALAVGFGPGNEVLYDAVGESVDGTQLFDYARIIAGVIVDLFT